MLKCPSSGQKVCSVALETSDEYYCLSMPNVNLNTYHAVLLSVKVINSMPELNIFFYLFTRLISIPH